VRGNCDGEGVQSVAGEATAVQVMRLSKNLRSSGNRPPQQH
jgi:hypothetical protein